MQCPAPDCHEAIKLCLKDKVPKKWLWWIITAFGLPAAGFATTTWYSARSADLKFTTVKQSSEQEARIRVLENRISQMGEALIRIERNQEEFRHDIKTLLQRTAKGTTLD